MNDHARFLPGISERGPIGRPGHPDNGLSPAIAQPSIGVRVAILSPQFIRTRRNHPGNQNFHLNILIACRADQSSATAICGGDRSRYRVDIAFHGLHRSGLNISPNLSSIKAPKAEAKRICMRKPVGLKEFERRPCLQEIRNRSKTFLLLYRARRPQGRRNTCSQKQFGRQASATAHPYS